MTVTSEQAELLLNKDNSKIIQVYGNDEFSTIVDSSNNKVYLLSTTSISRYNVIAGFTVFGKCEILDRDKANIFVEYTGLHQGSKKIDKLDEKVIANYMLEYLEPDLNELIKFDNNFDLLESNLLAFNDKATEQLVLKTLQDAGLTQKKFTFAYTCSQMQYLEDSLYSFAKLDFCNNKYDICQRLDNGKYKVLAKNGTVGNYKKIASSYPDRIFIVFNQRPKLQEDLAKIEEIVLTKVDGSSYTAANEFIKLQSDLDRALDEEVQRIVALKGHVDVSKAYYVDLEVYAEDIAKSIRKYKNLTSTDEKQECIKYLTQVYSDAFIEVNKAKQSLLDLQKIK